MVNWKKLKQTIPTRVQLNRNSFYEILWVEDFKDHNTLGESRPDTKQIVIKTNESPKLTTTIYCYEILHSISNEFDINLTENQILKLEKAFYYLLKKGNIFKE